MEEGVWLLCLRLCVYNVFRHRALLSYKTFSQPASKLASSVMRVLIEYRPIDCTGPQCQRAVRSRPLPAASVQPLRLDFLYRFLVSSNRLFACHVVVFLVYSLLSPVQSWTKKTRKCHILDKSITTL